MPRMGLSFCMKHHWQHLDINGICAWCKRERELALLDREDRLSAAIADDSTIDTDEHLAGVKRMLNERKASRGLA